MVVALLRYQFLSFPLKIELGIASSLGRLVLRCGETEMICLGGGVVLGSFVGDRVCRSLGAAGGCAGGGAGAGGGGAELF